MDDIAEAWYAVWEQLKAHNSEFVTGPRSGLQCTIDEIKRLQKIENDSIVNVSVKEQAQAWEKVWDLLVKHNNDLYQNGGGCGTENALIEIKKLQKQRTKILELKWALDTIRRNDESMSRSNIEQLQNMERVVAELLKD